MQQNSKLWAKEEGLGLVATDGFFLSFPILLIPYKYLISTMLLCHVISQLNLNILWKNLKKYLFWI